MCVCVVWCGAVWWGAGTGLSRRVQQAVRAQQRALAALPRAQRVHVQHAGRAAHQQPRRPRARRPPRRARRAATHHTPRHRASVRTSLPSSSDSRDVRVRYEFDSHPEHKFKTFFLFNVPRRSFRRSWVRIPAGKHRDEAACEKRSTGNRSRPVCYLLQDLKTASDLPS